MRKCMLFAVLTALLVSLFGVSVIASPPAQATITLVTTDEVSVAWNPDLSEEYAYNSSTDALRFGNYTATGSRPGRSFFRTYLRFPLGGIPAGSTIVSARLEMYVWDRRYPSGGDLSAGVYRVITGGWTEAGLGNTANWTWGTLPAPAAAPEATTIISAADQWYSWNVTGLVQAWVNGSAVQNGVMLSSDPVDDGVTVVEDQAVGARSRAGASPGLGPRLVVVYRSPSAPAPPPGGEIPEPSTLLLLGGGLATLWGTFRLRKRRR